jgi:hypothetical protein
MEDINVTAIFTVKKIDERNVISLDLIGELTDDMLKAMIKTIKKLEKRNEDTLENIYCFNEDNDEHITSDSMHNTIKEIAKEEITEYILAGKCIAEYYNKVIENSKNRNIIVKTSASKNGKIFTKSGWINESVTVLTNKVTKRYAKQLLRYKDYFFKLLNEEELKKKELFESIWKHIEKFSNFGIDYSGNKVVDTNKVIKLLRQTIVSKE